MKNVIKKISATAMAFTLLFTGSAISKETTTKSQNILTSHAEFAHNCSSYKTGPHYSLIHCGYIGGVPVFGYRAYYECAVCGSTWGA